MIRTSSAAPESTLLSGRRFCRHCPLRPCRADAARTSHRLTAGQYYSGATATNALSEKSIAYDRNGNITALTRYNSSGTATALTYAYTGNWRSAFSYDNNGNVTSDATNSLQTSYNLLNLPAQIKSGSSVKANYTYLSDGTKAAAYTSASAGKDYVGSFVYARGANGTRTLESVAFGGGRIRKSGSSYLVDYHVTDHLGSVRAIVTSGSIVEQDDYYPFGARHPNGLTQLSANRWRFGGKEEQDDAFGIAYSDFGARFLAPGSAAWTSIDPMAEKYYAVSPYAYCYNSPVNVSDPYGTNPIYSTTGEFLGTDEYGLAGNYIIMDATRFEQGMSHSASIENEWSDDLAGGVIESIVTHYSGLKDRPDYDGIISKSEADKWWSLGSGEPLYVDRSKIELPRITTKSFKGEGTHLYKNFVWGLSETGKVFGTLRLQLENAQSGEVSIGKGPIVDEYGFEMHKGRLLRNFATLVGRPGNNGKDFLFIGYGSKKIPAK